MSDADIDPRQPAEPSLAGATPAGAPPESAEGAPPADVAPGAVRQGVVTRLTTEQVFLKLDGDQQGYIPLIEFSGQPVPVVGDQLSVLVERLDGDAGLLVLSKRQAEALSFWEAVQCGDELEGVVTGVNKGGLDVDIGGARVFMPTAQVDVKRIHDVSTLIGEHVRGLVTQVDRATHDLILSRRKYLEKQQKEKRAAVVQAMFEGEVRAGTVTNLTDFGAFLDLGGADGLLHVSDISWGHLNHPSEMLRIGQNLEVRILKINRATGKISVGLKQLKPNPWENIESKYPEGTKVTGRVLRLADFGAFLELEEGIEALLPLSEMSWSRRLSHPAEIVKVGDAPAVVVLRVDARKKHISVGLRQTEENPWNSVETRFPVNSTHPGKVIKLADFGAFVELVPGVEGLIHISELSDKRVESVSAVLAEGQEVQVRVLKVDQPAQRISLSMRPPRETPARPRDQQSEHKSGPDKKKRKKALRGGLASHFDW